MGGALSQRAWLGRSWGTEWTGVLPGVRATPDLSRHHSGAGRCRERGRGRGAGDDVRGRTPTCLGCGCFEVTLQEGRGVWRRVRSRDPVRLPVGWGWDVVVFRPPSHRRGCVNFGDDEKIWRFPGAPPRKLVQCEGRVVVSSDPSWVGTLQDLEPNSNSFQAPPSPKSSDNSGEVRMNSGQE